MKYSAHNRSFVHCDDNNDMNYCVLYIVQIVIMLCLVMLGFIKFNVTLTIFIVASDVMQSVIMLSAVMVSVNIVIVDWQK